MIRKWIATRNLGKNLVVGWKAILIRRRRDKKLDLL